MECGLALEKNPNEVRLAVVVVAEAAGVHWIDVPIDVWKSVAKRPMKLLALLL